MQQPFTGTTAPGPRPDFFSFQDRTAPWLENLKPGSETLKILEPTHSDRSANQTVCGSLVTDIISLTPVKPTHSNISSKSDHKDHKVFQHQLD